MATGWMPPPELVTQALGICFTDDGLVVTVSWNDGEQWAFPGGTVEPGETVQQALVRTPHPGYSSVKDGRQSRSMIITWLSGPSSARRATFASRTAS
jgi:hypothetical protein